MRTRRCATCCSGSPPATDLDLLRVFGASWLPQSHEGLRTVLQYGTVIRHAPLVVAAALAAGAVAPGSIDAGFDAFFRAGNAGAAGKVADRLVKDGVDFDTA